MGFSNNTWWSLLLICFCFSTAFAGAADNCVIGGQSSSPAFFPNYGQIIDAKGLARPDILFTANVGGAQVFLSATRISYVFIESAEEKHTGLHPREIRSTRRNTPRNGFRLDMDLVDANLNPRIEPLMPAGNTKNFYLGHCPGGITNVPGFQALRISGIYEGVGMDVFFRDGKMKYNFVLEPGADIRQIRMRFSGSDDIRVEESDGSLQIRTPIGIYAEEAPRTFAGKQPVESWFVQNGNLISFATKKYAGKDTLVIDPVREWATFYGALGYENGHRLAVDPAGYVYMTGTTESVAFPVTTGAFQTNNGNTNGTADAFVVKMDPQGNRIWATYYGGNADDEGWNISADPNFGIYLTGINGSANFPVTAGGNNAGGDDAYLVKFDSSGARLWAFTLGGSQDETGYSVYADAMGVSVSGATNSTNFPVTAGAQQNAFGGGFSDGFAARYTPAGSLAWASYAGGAGEDIAWEVAATGGETYITGLTASTNLPGTAGGYQAANAGGTDAFLTKYNSSGNMLWNTYYGGSAGDEAYGIDVDDSSNVYLTGETSSTNFPTSPGALQTTLNSTDDAFLVKFDASGNRIWATYYGGSDLDGGYFIDWDQMGRIYLTGWTFGSGFPATPGAFQNSGGGDWDAFLGIFDPNGSPLYATFYGGQAYDAGYGVRGDGKGAIFFNGETGSSFFPVSNGAFQGTYVGNWDAFLVKFDQCNGMAVSLAGSDESCAGNDGSVDLTGSGGTGAFVYNWSTGATTEDISGLAAGTYSVTVTDSIGCVRSDSVTIGSGGSPSVSLGADTTLCNGASLVLDAGGGYAAYTWSTSATTQSITVTGAGTYHVVVQDTNQCTGSDTITVNFTGPLAAFSWTGGTGTPIVNFTDGSAGSGLSWAWDFGDGNTSTQQNPVHTYATAGVYTVCLTVIDVSNCQHTLCDTISVFTGLPEIGLSAFVSVYPNPARDYLMVRFDFPFPTDVKVSLIDLVGRKIWDQSEFTVKSQTQKFDLFQIPPALYILKVQTQYESLTQTLIVKKPD